MDQYFDVRIDGSQAPDAAAADAIRAIKAIPERVTWNDKATVEAARVAYEKVATTLQQGLVSNYSDLVSAEQRIKLLDPANQEKEDEDKVVKKEESDGPNAGLIIVVVLAILVALALIFKKQMKDFWNSEKMVKVRETVKTKTKPVTDKIDAFLEKTKIKAFFAKIGEKLAPVWAKVKPVLTKVWTKVKELLVKVWEVLKSLGRKVKAFVKAIPGALHNAMEKRAAAKFEKNKEAVEEALAEKNEVSENETEN
jgi:hypothetical protein